MIKDHKKFIIISHHDLKTVSIALMNYQEFLSYAQHMMNMILCSYKFFVCYYIDDIIIFSKTLENHLQHLNMIFSLFNRLEITLKKIKTHLNYLSIILLDQQVDDFEKTFDDLNFLHHQNPNQCLYIDLNASKQHGFDVMIYHMQNDHDSLLDHTVKENQQKIESILFLSKLLTDAEIRY